MEAETFESLNKPMRRLRRYSTTDKPVLPPALQLARRRADAAAHPAAPFPRRSRGGGEGGATGAGLAHQSAPGAGAVRAMESGLGARGGHGAVRVKHCATDMEAS